MPQAIDTYQTVLELDPDDLTALGRLDVLYQTAQNWHELLSVLTHEAELRAGSGRGDQLTSTGSPSSTRSTSTTSTRAIELYREILQRQPDHAPTLAALEGIKSGEQRSARRGRACSSRSTRRRASGRSSSASSRCRSRHADDPFAKVELLHRIARLYEESARRTTRAAFDTYARAVALDNGNEDDAPEPRAPRDGRRTAGRRSPRSTTPSSRSSPTTRSASSSSGCASRRSTRSSSRTSTTRSRATAACSRSIPRTRAPCARSIACSRRPSAGPSSPRSSRARPRSARRPTRSSSSSTASARSTRRASNDLDAAIAAYREVLSAAPEHADDARGARRPVRERHRSSSRSARSSSRSTRRRRVGEARSASTRRSSRTSTEPEERARDVLPHRRARRGAAHRSGAGASTSTSARSRSTRSTRRRGEEIERLAGIDRRRLGDARQRLRRRPRPAHDTNVQRVDRQAPRARLRGRARRHRPRRRRRTATCSRVEPLDADALANLDRIYISLEQWAELAGVLEQRVAAPRTTTSSMVELYARLGQVYEERLGADRRRDPRLPRDLRRARQDARRRDPGARAHLRADAERWPSSTRSTSASSRTRRATSQEAEIRAKLAHLAAERLGNVRRARSTAGSACSTCAARIRRRSARSRTSTSSSSSGPSSSTSSSASSTSPTTDDDRVNVLTRRARTLRRASSSATTRRSRTGNRVLDIDYANVAALRAIAAIWRRAERRAASSSARCTRRSIARRRCSTPRSSRRSTASSARPTASVLAQPYDAADAWRKLLEVDPATSRRWPRSRRSTAAEERGPTSSTSRCSAPTALEEPDGEDPRVPRGRRALAATRSTRRQGDARVREDPRDRADARRGVPRAREAAHGGGALGAAHRALPRRLDTRDETVSEKTRPPAPHRARLRGEARRQEPGVRRARQRASARTSATTRPRSYLERMAQATGRWGELIQTANAWLAGADRAARRRSASACASPSGTARTSGTPSTRSRTTRRSSRSTRTTSGRCARWRQLYRKNGNWQKLGATLTRALDVAVADDDRKEILTELGELLDSQMSQTDQARRRYYKRALEVDRCSSRRLEALERIYAARGENKRARRRSSPARCKALTEPRADRGRPSCASAALYEQHAQRLEQRRRRSYREVLEIDADEPARRCAASSASTRRSQQWPELVGVLERQLDVVTTERERIEVLMQARADPGGAVPQGRRRGAAPRAGRSRSTRTTRSALRRPRALLPPAAAVARAHQHLRAPHLGDARPQDEGRALRRDRAGLRRRGRGHRPRDRRLPQHRRPRRHEHPGARSALASSTRSRATRRRPSTT